MNETLFERRLEMVKLKAKGFSLSEVVKDLAVKYGRTRQALYHDYRQRRRWMRTVLQLDRETVGLDVLARHNEIYRMTVKEYLTGDNSSAKIGALRLMRDLNRDFSVMAFSPEVERDGDRNITIKWQDGSVTQVLSEYEGLLQEAVGRDLEGVRRDNMFERAVWDSLTVEERCKIEEAATILTEKRNAVRKTFEPKSIH